VKRAHKYNAKPVTFHGITFASTREGLRYLELHGLQKKGEIQKLTLQPEFECVVTAEATLWPEGDRVTVIGRYLADFQYVDVATGKVVVEDAKGVKSPIYKWKKKHVEAQFGIEIVEV
jgi:hypothetical protein